MLDAAIATEGADFALARVNGARGDEVLHIAPAGWRAAPASRSCSSPAPPPPPAPPIRACRCTRGRNAAACAWSSGTVSAGAADSAVNAAVRPGAARRCQHRSLPPAERRRRRELLRHADRRTSVNARTIACAPSRWVASLRAPPSSSSSRAARARCELTAAQHRQRPPDARHVRRDRTRRRRHGDARAVSRHRHRSRQARLQRQDGRARIRARRRLRAVAEDAAHRQRRRSVGPPAARDLHRRVRAKHGATTGKLDEQMLFYLLSRGIDRRTAQTLLQWAFIEDAVSRIGLRSAARAKSSSWSRRSSTRCPRSKVYWRAMNANPAYPQATTRSACGATSRSSRARCTASRWCSSTAPLPRSARPASSRRSTTTSDSTTPTCIAACTS